MDCATTSRLSAPCSVCRLYDGKTHIVGTAHFCGRHCPCCEEAPHLAIAGEPGPTVLQELELTAV